jgi:hypothetical protein
MCNRIGLLLLLLLLLSHALTYGALTHWRLDICCNTSDLLLMLLLRPHV